MNKKMQYMAMLEIPLSTVNITRKPLSKRRRKKVKAVDDDAVKKQLIAKINDTQQEESFAQTVENEANTESLYAKSVDNGTELTEYDGQEQIELTRTQVEGTAETDTDTVSIRPVKKKKTFKPTVVALQLVIIGVLVATIFLTSALNTNSGINVFFRTVFGNGSTAVDVRTHKDFMPEIYDDTGVVLDEGVVSFTRQGSVYVWCDGTVTDVQNVNGLYTVEITHSPNFKTILSGLDRFYSELNGTVYSNIPIGYCLGESTTMCFVDSDGSVITDYRIEDSSVIWAV